MEPVCSYSSWWSQTATRDYFQSKRFKYLVFEKHVRTIRRRWYAKTYAWSVVPDVPYYQEIPLRRFLWRQDQRRRLSTNPIAWQDNGQSRRLVQQSYILRSKGIGWEANRFVTCQHLRGQIHFLTHLDFDQTERKRWLENFKEANRSCYSLQRSG